MADEAVERARKVAENARGDHNSPERLKAAQEGSKRVNAIFKKNAPPKSK